MGLNISVNQKIDGEWVEVPDEEWDWGKHRYDSDVLFDIIYGEDYGIESVVIGNDGWCDECAFRVTKTELAIEKVNEIIPKEAQGNRDRWINMFKRMSTEELYFSSSS